MNNDLISKKEVLDKLEEKINETAKLMKEEKALGQMIVFTSQLATLTDVKNMIEALKELRKERENLTEYSKSYYELKLKNIINKLDRECLGKPVPEEFERGINRAIEIIMEEK